MDEQEHMSPLFWDRFGRPLYLQAFGIGLLVFVIILVSCLRTVQQPPASSLASQKEVLDENPPAFTDINDISERKTAFFAYLRPIVRDENGRILRERQRLLSLYNKHLDKSLLSRNDLNWLKQLCNEYGVSQEFSKERTWTRLLRRVDIIPEELALVQAAVESQWGTSRFAVEGNSFFGEWCFEKDCGAVPERREEGKFHEVEAFVSVRDSVRSYLNNLNTHNAYYDFRTRRYALRQQDKPLDVDMLIPGLVRYSEKREDYVQQIRDMMEQNRPLLEG